VNNAGIYPGRGRKIIIYKDSVICPIFQVAAARQADNRVHSAVWFYSHTLQQMLPENFFFKLYAPPSIPGCLLYVITLYIGHTDPEHPYMILPVPILPSNSKQKKSAPGF
jgi:hypothetical protein